MVNCFGELGIPHVREFVYFVKGGEVSLRIFWVAKRPNFVSNPLADINHENTDWFMTASLSWLMKSSPYNWGLYFHPKNQPTRVVQPPPHQLRLANLLAKGHHSFEKRTSASGPWFWRSNSLRFWIRRWTQTTHAERLERSNPSGISFNQKKVHTHFLV